MKTIQVRFHCEDSGFCRTTFATLNKPSRFFNRVEGKIDGGWYTVYPSRGYRENDARVHDDIVFEIVDSDGKVLFIERNGSLGAFSSIGRKAKEAAAEWVVKLGLQNYEDWRNWALCDMPVGYDQDNWLYGESECRESNIIGTYNHLGIKFAIIEADEIHRISKKKWRYIYIENQKTGGCEEICGYVLGLELGFLPGDEFKASVRHIPDYRYRFVGIEPRQCSQGDIHLFNLDTNTDTYVEPAWFETRKIMR